MPLPLIQWLSETKKLKTDSLLLEFCEQTCPGKTPADYTKIRDHLQTELDKVMSQVLDEKGIKAQPPWILSIPRPKDWRGARRYMIGCEEMEDQESEWPLLDDLERHRGYSELLNEKSNDSDKALRQSKDLGVPPPCAQMKLDPKSAEGLKTWLCAPTTEQTSPQALFIAIIQIGGRTGHSKDTLFLSRVVTNGPTPEKNPFLLSLKSDAPPPQKNLEKDREKNPQTAREKADELVSPHFRFLKKLLKYHPLEIKDWNDGIDPVYLKEHQQWNRAGCFYGFYLLLDRRGGSRFDFVASALNWYANGAFGNYVPRRGPDSLESGAQRVAYAAYAREVKELRLERKEFIQTLSAVDGGYHRYLLGSNWRGPKTIPYDYALQVLRTLAEYKSALGKSK